jgi:uncharacterized protein YyaL (SSP411 family)
VYLDGPGDTDGFSDDYAFLISGLIDLYHATFDRQCLQWADTLQQTQIKLFWDDHAGGFFRTPAASTLILRLKDDGDSAEPSANSVSARNLLRLGSLLGDRLYDEKAAETCQAFGEELSSQPWQFPSMLTAMIGVLGGMKDIVIVGKHGAEATNRFIETVRSWMLVNAVLIHVDPEETGDWLVGRNTILKEVLKLASDGGTPFVTVCEDYTCGLPIREVEDLDKVKWG